jgi:hypothetical protein
MRKFPVRPGQAIGLSRHCEMELAEGTRSEQYQFDRVLAAYRREQPARRKYASSGVTGGLYTFRGSVK